LLRFSMMAPSATAATPAAKAGAFDVATLFVADQAARDEAQLALAAAVKAEAVEFLGAIGYVDAAIKVSRTRLAPVSRQKSAAESYCVTGGACPCSRGRCQCGGVHNFLLPLVATVGNHGNLEFDRDWPQNA
jgi:hypothetical protein